MNKRDLLNMYVDKNDGFFIRRGSIPTLQSEWRGFDKNRRSRGWTRKFKILKLIKHRTGGHTFKLKNTCGGAIAYLKFDEIKGVDHDN